MKKFVAFTVAGIVALLLLPELIIWGIYASWADGCRSDGYTVVSVGYGVPTITKTYRCIDANNNIVDYF